MSAPLNRLVIGTRGSKLALWQAEHVAARLRALRPGLTVALQVIKTQGDKILDVPLAQVGGKGLFVKEIEQALVDGTIDLAVHSIKDVPSALIEGAVLAAIPAREDPRDALVCRGGRGRLDELPQGARVGTSSLRRQAQLLARRPDLQITALRGNVDTRLRRLAEGAFDAIVLAAAGLKRLGHAAEISELFDPPQWLPAAGQGALGIEARAADHALIALLGGLADAPTTCCVTAERAVLAPLGGGCHVPVAAHAQVQGDRLAVEALLAHPSGSPLYRAASAGLPSAAAEVGRDVGTRLLAQGADVLAELGVNNGSRLDPPAR